MNNISAPMDYQTELQSIERRRKLAEALQQQSFQPMEAGSTNGIPTPVSWTQGLAKLAQAYAGKRGGERADESTRALSSRYQADTSSDTQALIKALQGRQAQTIQPDPQEAQQSADYGTPNVGPVNIAAQTPTQSLQEALPQMKTPMGQQMASSYLMEQMKPKELFDKINPKDYTQESIAAYQQTRNPAVLVPVRSLHFANTGGATQGVDPTTGKPVGSPIAHTMTPDASANLAFKQFEFGNLSANQRAQLQNELTRIGISQQQLEEGRAQIVQDADGNIHVINKLTAIGRPATTPEGVPIQGQQKPTEAQMKAAVFHSQMQSATDELNKIPGYDPTNGMSQAETAVAGGRGNMLVGPNAQRAKQAQSQWAEAFLRFKTGAASTPAEVALNVSTFFPQVGDAPATVQQKARMRAAAERDMSMAAGRKIPQMGAPQDQQRVPGPMVVNWNDLGRQTP